VRRGLAASRSEAQRLIDEGLVTVAGAPATKAASQVSRADALVVESRARWASRGGHKLAGALDALGVEPGGRWCLDAGASTGGFTDVLLERGARRVVAVDVGYGQLVWRLRSDERVVVRDRTNVRHLRADELPPPPPDLVVGDLSFISLRLVVPALAELAAPTCDLLLLVKPQFEAGQGKVGRGGVVRDPAVWESALRGVAAAAREQGLAVVGGAVSPLPGPAGNVEFFLHLRRGDGASDDTDGAVRAALAAAAALTRAMGPEQVEGGAAEGTEGC
jgi:23S rRNA (cytidine1920-2'-O)/16S rRNA (cytidine1409-2'-O)-methyltransferase